LADQQPLTRPTPDGPQPPDWPDNWWAAYLILSRGGQQRAAASAVGRGYSTISKWCATWREWWGDDFLPPTTRRQSVANSGGLPPLPVAENVNRLAASSRIAQANLFGATAEQAAGLIARRLSLYTDNDLLLMSPRDLQDLARVAAMLTQQQNALLGDGEGSGMGGVRYGADVDLSGLDAPTDHDGQTLEAARLVITEFHLQHGTTPAAEIIDITEAS